MPTITGGYSAVCGERDNTLGRQPSRQMATVQSDKDDAKGAWEAYKEVPCSMWKAHKGCPGET